MFPKPSLVNLRSLYKVVEDDRGSLRNLQDIKDAQSDIQNKYCPNLNIFSLHNDPQSNIKDTKATSDTKVALT